MSETLETVVALLCRGYNEWIKDHGPGESGARAEGTSLTVVRDGTVYEVTVAPSSVWLGGTYRMHRTCALLNCTDPAHLAVREEEGRR